MCWIPVGGRLAACGEAAHNTARSESPRQRPPTPPMTREASENQTRVTSVGNLWSPPRSTFTGTSNLRLWLHLEVAILRLSWVRREPA
jgi:hypothetical protein